MSFTIHKVPKSGCASNKPETPGKIRIEKAAQKQSQGKGPIPFIDKLSVTLNVPNMETGHEIHSAYLVALAAGNILHPATKKAKGYNRAYRVLLDKVASSKSWPQLELRFSEQAVTSLRIDFVPVDLGNEGLIDLHSVLTTLMPNGWDFFVRHGTVTRIDIAVDFPHLSLLDFHVLPSNSPTRTEWSRKGELQTLQCGQTLGNQTLVYNREAKRKAKGTSGPGKIGLRVECRHRTPQVLLRELDSLQSPFPKVDMIARQFPAPKDEKPGNWRLFACAVEQDGLQQALQYVPEARRKKYRSHLKKHIVDWWQPEEMREAWLKSLKNSKISSVTAWC